MHPDKQETTVETVAFDVEGTLTEGTAWEGVRAYLLAEDQEEVYRAFQRKMMPRYLLFRLKLGSSRSFKEDWVAGILHLLAGRTRAEIDALAEQVVEEALWPKRREDVLAELKGHLDAGRKVLLVSGQFQPFLDAFVAKAGASQGIGTPGVWQDGRFSGELVRPFTIGEQKVALINGALDGGPLYAAYGDTGPDAAMLARSERPVAVYPDPALQRAANKQGWRVLPDG